MTMLVQRHRRRATLVVWAGLAALLLSLVEVPPAVAQQAPAECAGEAATIVGTSGDDELVGTDGRDVIDGAGGNDVILGRGGNDDLCGGDGADTIDGGEGNDFTRGGDGDDTIRGGPGDDILQGDFTEHTGPGGDDLLFGESGSDQIDGGPGHNRMDGGATPEGGSPLDNSDWAVYLLAETPVVADLAEGVATGQWGRDELVDIENLSGGSAADVLSGSARSEGLIGNGGDDVLSGRGGTDYLNGDGLVEQLAPLGHEPGEDILRGGDGIDSASFRGSFEQVFADLSTGEAEEGGRIDRMFGIEGLEGSDYADLLVGDDANNYMFGGSGEDGILGGAGLDTITGGPDDDLMFGGAGDDIVYYAGEGTPGVAVDLAAGTARGAGEDEIAQFEAVVGTEVDDVILGDNSENYFIAGTGNDTLDGRGGLDLVSFFAAPGPVTGSLATGAFSTQLPDGSNEIDTLIDIEGMEGSAFDDVLEGSSRSEAFLGGGGRDTLRGRGGHDWFVGDGAAVDGVLAPRGDDVIDGGDGAFDLVSYAEGTHPVTVDLRAGTGGGTGEGDDTIDGVEAARGTRRADILRGDGRRNVLFGLRGKDLLVGRGRADQLVGGHGRDRLRGGKGADLCVGGAGTSCQEFARPRNHPLVSVFAEWERHRFRRRLRLLARLQR